MDGLRLCLELCMWGPLHKTEETPNTQMLFFHPAATGELLLHSHTPLLTPRNMLKHKLHTVAYDAMQRQRRVHLHAGRRANVKHTSRLSCCFQLPDRPRGNQNFDTHRLEKESGGARQCQRLHTQTWAPQSQHTAAVQTALLFKPPTSRSVGKIRKHDMKRRKKWLCRSQAAKFLKHSTAAWWL